jgi:hypothetical protein
VIISILSIKTNGELHVNMNLKISLRNGKHKSILMEERPRIFAIARIR